jgi:hypothetical protein
VDATFKQRFLDTLIFSELKNLVAKIGLPSQPSRNSILAALTGNPVITVPIGMSIGMEILGLPWSESKLLAATVGIDDLLYARRMPNPNRWPRIAERASPSSKHGVRHQVV